MLGLKLQQLHYMWEEPRHAKERGPDPTAQFVSTDVHLLSRCPSPELMSNSEADVHLWSGCPSLEWTYYLCLAQRITKRNKQRIGVVG